MARRPTTRSMCAGLLVFSTSKKIAWRAVGLSRSGDGGGTRVAKTGSGATTDSENSGSGSTTGGGGGSGLWETTSTGTTAFGAFVVRRRRDRPVVVRSMPASYGTRRRPATRVGVVAGGSTDEEDTRSVPLAMLKSPRFGRSALPRRAGRRER